MVWTQLWLYWSNSTSNLVTVDPIYCFYVLVHVFVLGIDYLIQDTTTILAFFRSQNHRKIYKTPSGKIFPAVGQRKSKRCPLGKCLELSGRRLSPGDLKNCWEKATLLLVLSINDGKVFLTGNCWQNRRGNDLTRHFDSLNIITPGTFANFFFVVLVHWDITFPALLQNRRERYFSLRFGPLGYQYFSWHFCKPQGKGVFLYALTVGISMLFPTLL